MTAVEPTSSPTSADEPTAAPTDAATDDAADGSRELPTSSGAVTMAGATMAFGTFVALLSVF